MAIDGSTFSQGATIAPTGGTSKTINRLYVKDNTLKAYCSSDADELTRREFDFTVKDPKVNASSVGGYTQGRAVMLFKSPFVKATGDRTVNTVRVEMAYDIETDASEREALRVEACQILFGSDFDAFWKSRSLT